MSDKDAQKSKNEKLGTNFFTSIRFLVLVSFLAAVIVPVAITLFVSLTATQNSLVEVIDQELQGLTASQADNIAESLETQVNVLSLLASDAAVRNVLRTTNSGYPTDQEAIDARLLERENEWLLTVDGTIEEPFRVRAVYTGTLSTTTLADFQRTFAGHTEIMLTDRYGGVVAATRRTEDYSQGDEDWWRFAYNSGVGALYMDSNLIFDASANILGVRIAVPVIETDAAGNAVVLGILRTHYDIGVIQNLITTVSEGQSNAILLVNATGEILTQTEDVPEAFAMPTNFASLNRLESGDAQANVTSVNGENYLIAVAKLETEARLTTLDNLNWYAVVIEAESAAFAPVNVARNAALIPAVIIGILGVIVSIFLALFLTRPLQRLTAAASRIGQERDWTTRVDVESDNEFGQLGRAFNTMAGELQGVFADLETRIASRTADLETAGEIAAAANQIRQREELLSLTVNLIRDRFDFYYVQAYLVDEVGVYALLADGTGYAGRRLLSRKHRLPLDGQSLVANSIRNGEIIVVQDTTADERWLPNELLPDTRSEIVVPLRSAKGIIGVLDIQHSIPETFDAGQQQLFKTLADQLAVTFENVFLLDSAEERAKKLATVAEVGIEAATERDVVKMLKAASRLTRDNFALYHAHVYLINHATNRLDLIAGAGDVGSQMVDNHHGISLNNEHSIVVQAMRRREVFIENDVTKAPAYLPNPLLPETRSELAVPMIVRDDVVGVLDVQAATVGRFTDEDAQVLQILSSQLAVAVDNVRTLEEANTARDELNRIFNSTLDMLGSASFEGFFTRLNKAWSDTLGYSDAELMAEPFINFVHPNDVDLTLAEATKLSQGVEAVSFVNRYRKKDGHYIWMSWNAAPDIDAGLIHFVARDVTQQRQNEDEIRRRATKMQAVTDISSQISGILDVSELLWQVSNLSQQLLNHYHVQVYIYDEETKRLYLRAGSGEAGQDMVARQHSISFESDSLVARAARNQEIVVINDVSLEDDFLPNPSLPETQAEMAVPLLYAGEILGVLDIQDDEIDVFSDVEIQVKRTLANQISVAMQNARQFELTQVRLQEVLATNAIADFVREDVNLESMLENVMVVAYNSLGADNLIMSMYDATADQWNGFVAVGEGVSTEIVKSFIDPGEAFPHGMQAINELEIVVIEDTKKYANFPEHYINELGLKSVMVVPILVQELAIGVIFLNYSSQARRFSEDDLRLARTIASQISVGIERRQSEDQVRRQSTLVEASRDFIGIADLTGNIVYVNPAGLEMLNVSGQDLQGKPLNMVYPESEWDMINEQGLTTALTQGSWRGETYLIRSDGSIFPVEETIFVVKDDAGHILNFATIATDITERVRGQRRSESLAMVNSLLTQADDEAAIVNAVASFAIQTNPAEIVLSYITVDNEGQALGSQDQIVWRDGQPDMSASSLGKVLNVSASPLNQLWIDNPDNVTIVESREDERLSAKAAKWMRDAKFESLALIPLRTGRQWQGVLTIKWADVHNFESDELEIYTSLAQTLSAVVSSRRAFLSAQEANERAQRRAAELETVANVSAATTTILDLDELLQSVADLTKTNFNFYHAHIYLYDEDTHNLVLAAGAGDVGRMMKEHGHRLNMQSGTGLVARAARERKAVVVNDTAEVRDFLPNPMLPETRSEMALPMVVGSDLIGVLDIQSELPNRFGEDDIRIQTTLGDQVAVAIRNAQAFDRERKTVEQLKEVDRLKQEFLANMSHELRTPLNSIIGYSEVLLDGVDGDLNDDAMEDVEAIHTSGKHLLSIINEILDLAKIDAGQMRLSLQEKDIVEVLKHIVVSSQVLVKDKAIDIALEEVSPVPMAYFDSVRLNQIMLNLVGNAIKFTEKGTVTVRYGMDEGKIRVEIVDSGIGMNPEQLGLIFERFSQVDGSSTRRAGGTGLGLTITKQLVEMHGGIIDVSSEEGVGSTFFFYLPTAEDAKRLMQDAEEEAMPEVGD